MKTSSRISFAVLAVALATAPAVVRGQPSAGRAVSTNSVIVINPVKVQTGPRPAALPPVIQIVAARPGEIISPLPRQIVRSLPGQKVRALPGQIVRALPGQMIQPLPGQIVQALPGQIVR